MLIRAILWMYSVFWLIHLAAASDVVTPMAM